jgi:hypothetical protein
MMTRRTLLKRGLFGGALLLLGGSGVLAVLPSKDMGTALGPLLALDPKAFNVLVAFAARVVTAKGSDPIVIAQGVDKVLSSAVVETRDDLNKLLGLFENALGGLLLDGRVTPFTRLDPEAQDKVLEAWRSSRLAIRRTGFQALRKLCLATWYGTEASWAPIGYAPPAGLNAIAYPDSKMGTPEWIAAQKPSDG